MMGFDVVLRTVVLGQLLPLSIIAGIVLLSNHGLHSHEISLHIPTLQTLHFNRLILLNGKQS